MKHYISEVRKLEKDWGESESNKLFLSGSNFPVKQELFLPGRTSGWRMAIKGAVGLGSGHAGLVGWGRWAGVGPR